MLVNSWLENIVPDKKTGLNTSLRPGIHELYTGGESVVSFLSI